MVGFDNFSGESIGNIITENKTININELWTNPGFQFNELGPLAKNCSFFSLRDDKIESNYRFYTHETTFGFVDTLHEKQILNEHLLFFIEMFQRFNKKTCQVLLIKDFIAKRSAKPPVLENSIILDINFCDFKFSERKVGDIKETEFNLRENMDQNE